MDAGRDGTMVDSKNRREKGGNEMEWDATTDGIIRRLKPGDGQLLWLILEVRFKRKTQRHANITWDTCTNHTRY